MRGDPGSLIGAYSHGMKQKFAIIGALIHEPKLFVLDESFVGLDPEAVFRLKEVFRELCGRGAAIFFSTHNAMKALNPSIWKYSKIMKAKWLLIAKVQLMGAFGPNKIRKMEDPRAKKAAFMLILIALLLRSWFLCYYFFRLHLLNKAWLHR